MEAFELTEGYGSTAQAPAARKWRGAAALKLAVMTLAVVAVLAISGGFSTRDQVYSVPGPCREAWPRVVLLALASAREWTPALERCRVSAGRIAWTCEGSGRAVYGMRREHQSGSLTFYGVLALAQPSAVCSLAQEVELGSDSMKTINSLLAHIDKITHSAKSGHAHDKAVKEKLQHTDDAVVRFRVPACCHPGSRYTQKNSPCQRSCVAVVQP